MTEFSFLGERSHEEGKPEFTKTLILHSKKIAQLIKFIFIAIMYCKSM